MWLVSSVATAPGSMTVARMSGCSSCRRASDHVHPHFVAARRRCWRGRSVRRRRRCGKLLRFTGQARTANQALVELLSAIAKRKSATLAQVASAWLLAQHPWIVPIPGTTKPHRLRENTDAVDLELTPEDLEEITAAADRVDVQGERYPAHMQRWINR